MTGAFLVRPNIERSAMHYVVFERLSLSEATGCGSSRRKKPAGAAAGHARSQPAVASRMLAAACSIRLRRQQVTGGLAPARRAKTQLLAFGGLDELN